MASRIFGAAVVLCFLSAALFGQDPTKVEPKHYKLQFENDRVQVVNVHYGPHEKSEMHDHPGGVVVVVTGGHLRFTDPNGKITEVYSKAGESRWFPPFKHKVENVGDEPYNAVYVGIKTRSSDAKAGGKPNSQEGYSLSPEELASILGEYATNQP